MPSRRTTLVRTVTVGCAVAGAAAIGAAPANALPVAQPAFTSHEFRHDFFSGDPYPFGYEVVDAATNGSGVVRFDAGDLCNALTGRCSGYTIDISVQWINFANGATGTTTVGRTAKFVTTGRGPIGLSVTGPRFPNLPTLGAVNS